MNVKKIMGTIVMLMLCVSLVLAGCGDGKTKEKDEAENPGPDTKNYRVRTEDLKESGDWQERWLSLPDSRVVLNPYNFQKEVTVSQSEHSNSATMPLNIGYLAPEVPKSTLGSTNTSANLLMLLEDMGSERDVASGFQTFWQPDKLDFTASYSEGLELSGTDFFYDAKTVVRRVQIDGGKLSLAGLYVGTMTYSNNTLNLKSRHFRAAITFSFDADVKFYKNGGDMYYKGSALKNPASDSVWAVDVPEGLTEVDISIAFDSVASDEAALAKVAAAPFEKLKAIDYALILRTRFWNDYLYKIPYLSNFDMPSIDNKGITEDDAKHDYYVSWALIYASVLPAAPEVGFNYRQVTCGKPSMWDEGAPGVTYSATWESFIGIQQLAYIYPELAWDAYKGLMSLVDEQGRIGGESLPSEKAHTAWVCYQNMPDDEALEEIYPALKRYQLWRMANPRWIHGPHDYENEKDYDFASVLIMDMRFTQKICDVLGYDEEKTFWETNINNFYGDIKTWFYLPNRAAPYQYNVGGTMSGGARAWVVKSLWMDVLDGEYLTRTLNFALSGFNPAKSFCGYSAVKYDSFTYIIYGLIKHGKLTEAKQYLESGMRDVPRSKFIGEAYYNEGADDKSVARGVRPSLFGAGIMIESAFLSNGFFRYNGGLACVNLYDRVTTVENIHVNGKVYTLSVDGIYGTVKVIYSDGTSQTRNAPRGQFVDLNDLL